MKVYWQNVSKDELDARWRLWVMGSPDRRFLNHVLHATQGCVLDWFRTPLHFDLPFPEIDLQIDRPSLTISAADECYPNTLFELESPPWFLYYRGDLMALQRSMISVVGARDIDGEGIRLARWCGDTIARKTVSIVSGGARGVDRFVHEAVATRGGRGVIVAPHGLDTVSPKTSEGVYQDIMSKGGIVIGEYPGAMRPRRHTFHRRNQLIAALGSVLVVVRARERSGTMLTVEFARDLDRRIYAVPGVPDDLSARACNRMIADGTATMFLGADSLLSGVAIRPKDSASTPLQDRTVSRAHTVRRTTFSTIENRVLDAAVSGLDDNGILSECDVSVSELLGVRMALELRGALCFDPQTGGFRCVVDRVD